MHRLILALAVVAVMSIGGSLGGGPVSVARAAIPQPIYFWGNVAQEISPQPEVIRPSVIAVFAEGSWVMEQLRWTRWGSSVAHATGISSASDGNPSMATGKRIKTPGQVTLSSPGPFRGHEVYRCFTLTIPSFSAADQHLCLKVRGGVAWLWPVPTTKPTAPAPVTSPPVGAVRILADNYSTCKRNFWAPGHPLADRSAFGPACPVTPRLRSWLQTRSEYFPPSNGNVRPPQPPANVVIGLDLISRCFCGPPTTFRLGANNGSVASVMELTHGLVTFVVLHTKGVWLVDDTYCTHGNRATTSIYQRPLASCSG